MDIDQRFRLFAIAVVIPHLQVQPLQVDRVLLGVEKRAANSLLPNTCSDHLQTKRDKEVKFQFNKNVLK